MRDDDDDDLTNLTFTELIERSSFGTPEAVVRRASVPREVVDEIMARLRESYPTDP